jgi:hypothetical protein
MGAYSDDSDYRFRFSVTGAGATSLKLTYKATLRRTVPRVHRLGSLRECAAHPGGCVRFLGNRVAGRARVPRQHCARKGRSLSIRLALHHR